jgi:large repetitive protein
MRTRASAYVVMSSLLCASPGLALAQDTLTPIQRTFTTEADFALGTFEGTRAQAPSPDQLRIDSGATVPPFIWVAIGSSGLVTKLDTRTGAQVASYDSVLTRNWDGSLPAVRAPRDPCNFPTLAAVDTQGNAFVVNRGDCAGTQAAITKYAGSLEACVDRNGNGQIDTSSDVNGDRVINTNLPSEFLGQADECILWTKNYAGVGDPGRSLVVDADQHVWAAGFSSARLYRLHGQTGAVLKVIDLAAEGGATFGIQGLAIGPGGYLYTSDTSEQMRTLKIDPNAAPGSAVVDSVASPVPTVGVAVDPSGVVWLGADTDSASGVVRMDFTSHTAEVVGGGGGCVGRTHGVAVDASGDIWAACLGANRLLRVSPSGAFKATWVVHSKPEGAAVGGDGRIWVTSSSVNRLSAVTPDGASSPQAIAVSGNSFTYGDMTGFQHHRFILRRGAWSVVHDSGQLNTHWGTVSWNDEPEGTTPPGTRITVAVRAADTREALASRPFAQVSNHQRFAGIDGRFFEVKVSLRSANFGGDPVLSDLTITSYSTPPVAVCGSRNVCAAATTCTAEVSVDDGSYDPDGDPITLSQSPAGPYGIGTRTVSLTVADPELSASCSASVRVRDCEPPAITCRAPVQAECSGNESATVSAGGADATDACSAVDVSGPGPASYPLGTTPVTYTATDAEGNTAACTTSVTVVDTQGPALALNGAVDTALECGSTYMEEGATANDLCVGPVAFAISGSVDPTVAGTYTLSYTARDPSGNTSTATRRVTVTDAQGPSLALLGPAALVHECAEPFMDPWATAVDACAGDVSDRVTVSGAVDVLQPGSYVLTYGATDPSGNAAAPVRRTVEVRDTLGPVLVLHGANPLALECMRDGYSEPGATAVDACSGDRSGDVTIERPVIDSALPGSYPVTYRVADSSGNLTTAVREVRVQDTLPPELYLSGATTLLLECKVDTFVEEGAVAIDLCSGDLTESIVRTGSVDTDTPGAYPLRYRAQDGRGLVAERVRDVRVVDTQPPTLTLEGSSTPVVECSRDALVNLGASATDLCAGDITHRITLSGTSAIVAPGTYPITYNVTDPSGNAAPPVTRNVTVRDTVAPVVTITGEASMTLECGVDTYTEQGATAYDACHGDMTSAINIYGNGANTAAVGTYSIQYGVWDSSGNTTMALRTVKVVDRLPPVLSLVGPAVVQHECASGPYEDQRATATDACYGDLSLSVTTTGSVNAWARGSYTLTYNVQDSTLLKATPITRTVEVVDTRPPTLEYRQVFVWPADQGMRSFTLSDCVTANDVCDGWANANNGTILSIYSDEPEDAPGDGDGSTLEDIIITGKSSFRVRAERQSNGNGRVYGVRFELKDLTGNARTGLCHIQVPPAEGGTADDDGPGAGYTVLPPPPASLASRPAP